MSEKNFVKPLKCPNCKQELGTIAGDLVTAVYELQFSQKRGTYIPYSTVLDIERFVCSNCGQELPDSLFESQIDKNVVAVKLSGAYKTILIDLQELSLDTKYAEFCDKLPNVVKTKKVKPKKPKRKEVLKK
jgi:hypothetical protein